MDLAFVERLIDLVGRSPIDELDLALKGWRVRLVKAGAAAAAATPDPRATPAQAAAVEPRAARPNSTHVIAAGIFGVFYRAPAPGQPPFVSVGDAVAEGQTLGILEAMKTFTPIEADRAGTVAEILQEEGASVQSGVPLFTLAPPG